MKTNLSLDFIVKRNNFDRKPRLILYFFFRDNYGFVTFHNKKDAFSAIEHGNDDTSYPRVDLCFGGRRAFCKEKYADLGMYVKSDYCTLA